MVKTGSTLFLGIVIGVLATVLLSSGTNEAQTRNESAARPILDGNPASATGPASSQDEALRQRIAELEDQIADLQQPRLNPAAAAELSRPPAGSVGVESTVERLVAQGFTQMRAEVIEGRLDELIEERRAQTRALENSPYFSLRQEIGDTEYERFLQAMGQSTEVEVYDVAENSAAAAAGLIPGDIVISYDGNRVFDPREIAQFVSEGTPGETATLEILREGQPMQVPMFRGPLDARFVPSGPAVLDFAPF